MNQPQSPFKPNPKTEWPKADVCPNCSRGLMAVQKVTVWMNPPPVGPRGIHLGYDRCTDCGFERDNGLETPKDPTWWPPVGMVSR